MDNAMKKIEDYLSKDIKRQPIQPWITPEVYTEVNLIRKKLGKTWSEIVQACLEHLIDQVVESSKKRMLKELNPHEKPKRK